MNRPPLLRCASTFLGQRALTTKPNIILIHGDDPGWADAARKAWINGQSATL